MSSNQADLLQLIRTDPLTGVGNMISFYESLFNRIDQRANEPFYLISADMNGLGKVNETHGQEVGDTAVRETGKGFAPRGSTAWSRWIKTEGLFLG